MAIPSKQIGWSNESNLLWQVAKEIEHLTRTTTNVTVTNTIANPVPITGTVIVALPIGAATSALQTTGNTSVSNLDTNIGAKADAAATTDTGTFSIVAFIKRGLQNWTTILARIPALGATIGASSLPVTQATETATGNITTQNLVPAGVATTGSAVEVILNGNGQLAIQITGTYTGTLSLQVTVDGTNWITTTTSTIFSYSGGTTTSTIASATTGVFQVTCAGFLKARITGLAAITGTAVVTLKATSSASIISFSSSLLPGVNTIGSISSVINAGTPSAPATPYFLNSAATTNANLVLTNTSGLQAFYATNTGATAAYVKLFNKATAPTIGTDVPEMIIVVPAAVAGVPGVASLPVGFSGYRFALGLGIGITGAAADTDTTAVAAGQVKVKLSRTV